MKKLFSRIEYEEMMKKTADRGGCQLCNLKKQIVLGISEYWFWIANIAPYWRYHTMFIPKRHIEDITELSIEEFTDLQNLYLKVKSYLLSLKLKQVNDKPLDQFILMFRIREEAVPDGSTYPKPMHLHIHFVPDRGGVDRFKIDETAIDVDIESIALK